MEGRKRKRISRGGSYAGALGQIGIVGSFCVPSLAHIRGGCTKAVLCRLVALGIDCSKAYLTVEPLPESVRRCHHTDDLRLFHSVYIFGSFEDADLDRTTGSHLCC